jgi:hypothetical protein
MHVDELPQIFRDCCGTDEGRYVMSKPFAIGPYVYAADGRIAVRMPVPRGGVSGASQDRIPNCDTVAQWESKFGEPINIPDIPPAEMTQAAKCEDCDGKGCDECQGGIVQPREKSRYTAFGKIKLNNHYLRILKTAGAKLRLPAGRAYSHVAVAFVGDGWDGLLMCCKPDAEDEA